MYSTSKVSQQINLQGIDSHYTHKSFKVLSLTSKSQHFISSFHKIYYQETHDTKIIIFSKTNNLEL